MKQNFIFQLFKSDTNTAFNFVSIFLSFIDTQVTVESVYLTYRERIILQELDLVKF